MSYIDDDKTEFNAADIERYLNGQMPAKEMHAIEKAAMEDPFLADAIEGYGKKQSRSEKGTANDLEELQALIKKRIRPQQKRVIPIYYTQWWKIAALVLLIAGSAAVIYYIPNSSDTITTTIAKNTTQEQKVQSKDSSLPASSHVMDTTALVADRIQNRQPLSLLKRKPEPLKKTDAKSIVMNAPSPAIEKLADSVPANKESKNDIASTMETVRDFKTEPREMMSNRKIEAYYKTKPINVFSGKVISQDNKPVSNAAVSVRLDKMDTGYVTDSNGYFKFTLPDTLASVVIDGVGFEKAKVELRGNRVNNEIRLKEIDQSLSGSVSGVVVSGYGTAKKTGKASASVSPAAEPVNGADAYYRYIETNKKIPAQLSNLHGEVIISFMVGKNGRLSNFKIVKSLSAPIDKEAIRLIKEGPSWKVMAGKKTRATFAIQF